jgi:20S proteasome alpha/beta subunit
MTLLIFVQCEDGGILAADRKATAESGLSLEEMKCQFYPNGWAVAGAGNNGSAIQKLFTDLRNGVTVEHVEERVADKLAEYMQIMKSMKLEVECIVLAERNR